MVLPTAPLPPRPAPVSPPANRPTVAGVKPVGDRQPDDPGRRRPLRRRLLDLLMDEVGTLSELPLESRDRIRRNLEAFARQHPGPGDDARDGIQDGTQDGTGAAVPISDPVAVAAPEHPALSDEERAQNRLLAADLRRVLALHTLTAQKIASYIHMLQATHPDTHALEIEV
ncbi:hypothetical protein [Oleisolibacter albus]|uniref:hypothetical protein n=1 Tax=Oleisolibacter albus TaxID=2171757 RepID=UPI000DF3A664|nr:hypothetical protein [Oleisolibacter albus]